MKLWFFNFVLVLLCVSCGTSRIENKANYYNMPNEVILIKTYNFNDPSQLGKTELNAIDDVLNDYPDFGQVVRSECKWQNTGSACYAIWLKKDPKWSQRERSMTEDTE